MKKLYQIFAFALVLIMAVMLTGLVGCYNAQETAAPTQASATPEPTPVQSTSTPEPTPEPVPINIAALKGPTGMGMSFLMQASENGKTQNTYDFTLSGAPDDVVSKFISGEVDVAAVPINLAAVLMAKTDNVKILAVNTLGVLYILENGDTIHSVADLAGKTIEATGQAATPEYILSYILQKNGIADSVTVEYLTEHSELAALMASGDVTLGMLPEPNVTVVMSKNPDVRVALNLTDEWEAVTGTQLVQGCIIARADFAEENHDALQVFLDEYAQSVENVNTDHAAAAELIAKYGIVESAAVAEKAIDNCNIVCMTGDEMKESADAMFAVLFEANPKSIGGAIPDESIYF
ncbi:MAG: ABC transporter substrate-binding protein [Oscillospiraceae bacterium]